MMNYPTLKKNTFTSTTYHGNRGMGLENDINNSNKYYLDNDIAIIHKKPTPITIAKVDYPSRLKAVIKEGYFKTPSTTDYNGIYRGKYVDFEAKETKNKSFPLTNIHIHQIEHLKKITKHGGIGFVIVRFTSLNETYLIMAEKIFEFIDNDLKKSIPYDYFKNNAFMIKNTFNPLVDYLKIIDKEYFGGTYEKI